MHPFLSCSFAAVIAAGVALCGAAPGRALAIPPESTTTAVAPLAAPRGIEALLKGGGHPWLAHPNLADVRDSLRVFYARRDNRAAWMEQGRPTDRARSWVSELERLDDYGVPATDCDAPQLAGQLAEFAAGASRGELEALQVVVELLEEAVNAVLEAVDLHGFVALVFHDASVVVVDAAQ